MNRGALIAERGLLLTRHRPEGWGYEPPVRHLPHGPAECPRTLAALRTAARVAVEEAALEASIKAAQTAVDPDARKLVGDRRRRFCRERERLQRAVKRAASTSHGEQP